MSIARLRVHIAPVGFEIDRIVLPATEMRADRVWLLIHESTNDSRAKSYETAITKKFKRSKIEIETVRTDRKDVFKILQVVKRIIKMEWKNDIYVNVSSGSKIQAIACTMACMMFNERENITPYYAEPQSYPSYKERQQSVGLKSIIELPRYQIQIPKQELVQALKIIRDNKGKITKKDMARLAEDEKLIVVNAGKKSFEQSRFASLDKNIIQPLTEQWKFVEVEKIGRTRWIKLTQEGINAVEFLI